MTAISADAVYDRIGIGYTRGRQPEPRWEKEIAEALGNALRVLNVGAGTGSYEPRDRTVLAVEPSLVMIEQRPAGSATAVRASAEDLPFADHVFDAAIAILSVHHWTDLSAGIAEMRRVARRQMVLAYDPWLHAEFWLCDYIPAIAEFEMRRTPPIEQLAASLQADDIRVLSVPADMRDGVLIANWRRPAAYLDPEVRACCSGLAQLRPEVVEAGIRQLRDDLADGTWDRRYGHLRNQPTYDGGYRLLIAGSTDAALSR